MIGNVIRMSNEEEASAAVKAVNTIRLPGTHGLLRARLAYKTNRRDGPPEEDEANTFGTGTPEPDTNATPQLPQDK